MSNALQDRFYLEDMQRAEAKGRQSILARVRALPSPWRPHLRDTDSVMVCDWCNVEVDMPYYEKPEIGEMGYECQPHPANGCLWAEAQGDGTA